MSNCTCPYIIHRSPDGAEFKEYQTNDIRAQTCPTHGIQEKAWQRLQDSRPTGCTCRYIWNTSGGYYQWQSGGRCRIHGD